MTPPTSWAEALAHVAGHTPPAVLERLESLTLIVGGEARVFRRDSPDGYQAITYSTTPPRLPVLTAQPRACACGAPLDRGEERCRDCFVRWLRGDR